MKSVRRLLALAATLTLVACQDAPVVNTPSSVTFAGKAPIRLNVAQINVVESYRSTMQKPFVEHTAPTTPAAGVKLWASQRLAAAGTQGTVEVIIDDASIKETPLTKKDGIEGFFTDDQDARYDAHLRVTIRLYDGLSTVAQAESVVELNRMRTINEKASAAQRDAMFAAMVNDMMLQFDAEAESRLRQYFARFIVG
ncbi:MAG: hypothetical protein DI582_09040 [Azospirillum brasilense]|nr:MAG: hypothetical protein DI582_09040 [Azospirillum brasilense]